MSFQTLMQLLGGVGIFLFAIKLLSESLQLLAGNKLRSLIAALTKTPLLGVIVGTFVTVLLQSSSATTVMTVSFVDAGLMTLKQAVGVIMGANIGTTVTGQIVAFKVKDFAYLFVIVGVLLNLLCASQNKKYLGTGIMAFGLLFIGMQTMESAMYFLRDRKDIFLMFAHNPILGVLAGTGLTLLVQSSSATVGLTIALGAQGLLPIEAAIPIILGDNIGTTITAMLAAIGTTRSAKQASAAHVSFNLLGVAIFLPFLPFYVPLIQLTADSVTHQIANAHTLFNVCNTLLFLPFAGPFTQLIRKVIPDEEKKKKSGARYLDPLLLKASPIVAVSALKNECDHMAKITTKQLKALEDVFFSDNVKRIDAVLSGEEKLDLLTRDITEYAAHILQQPMPEKVLQEVYKYTAAANNFERIGDEASNLIEFYNFRTSSKVDFSKGLIEELHNMFLDARKAYELSYEFFANEVQNETVELKEEVKREVEELVKEIRKKEVTFSTTAMLEVAQGAQDTQAERVFIDCIRAIESIAYRSSRLIGQE